MSSVYLRGQADRGFFDLSGYHFEIDDRHHRSAHGAARVPVLDYNRPSPSRPTCSGGIGGEVEGRPQRDRHSRTEALYQSVGPQTLDEAYNLYNVCEHVRAAFEPILIQ